MDKSELEKKWLSNLKEDFEGFIFKYDLYSDRFEHDHCRNCMAKISKVYPNSLRGGYHTLDGYNWFCSNCFNKYKDILGLVSYDPKKINDRYKNILDMLCKELWKYDNKKMFELLRIKGIFYYWKDISLFSTNIKITPYIYDHSKNKIVTCYANKAMTIDILDYDKLREIAYYYDCDGELHEKIDDTKGWESIMLLFEEI